MIMMLMMNIKITSHNLMIIEKEAITRRRTTTKTK